MQFLQDFGYISRSECDVEVGLRLLVQIPSESVPKFVGIFVIGARLS